MKNDKELSLSSVNIFQIYTGLLLMSLFLIYWMIGLCLNKTSYVLDFIILTLLLIVHSFIPFKNSNIGYLYNYIFNYFRNFCFVFGLISFLYLSITGETKYFLYILLDSLLAGLIFSMIMNYIFNFVPMCLFVLHLDYHAFTKLIIFILSFIPFVRLLVVFIVLSHILYTRCMLLQNRLDESNLNTDILTENTVNDGLIIEDKEETMDETF